MKSREIKGANMKMTGAQIIIKTAAKAGIKICFANPGTTEMPLVEALDFVPGIEAKLGLFEGCCTGAADGYARMTGVPALTLLHLGPGLANAFKYSPNALKRLTDFRSRAPGNTDKT